jgi:predicted metalloprotease
MRWKRGRRSGNVEDRRGNGTHMGASAAPALLRVLPVLLRSKVGRILLIGGVVVIFGGQMLGLDTLSLLTGEQSGHSQAPPRQAAGDDEMVDFVSVVLGDTEQTWQQYFSQMQQEYRYPKLVLFTGSVRSACGRASAAVGPFYCPGDQKLYLDLSFFQDLAQRHGAPGDFAQAYVIAHEVGHHVQTLLGISEQVQQAGEGRGKAEVNALSVRQELQADCFAGIWGHAASRERQMLDPGDLEEALQAASSIGDDRLQREAGGAVVPDSFTHGTSAQRMRWFKAGFETGDLNACDTFSAEHL